MNSLLTKVGFLVSISLFLSACSLPQIGAQNAGTQITSTPQASVFFDNEPLNQTPIIKQDIKPGSHTVRITSPDPNVLAWEAPITFNPGVMTIIDRQLSADPTQSTGYILSFEKLSDKKATEVNIITTQDKINVSIDGSPAGFSPVKSNSITPGAHTFTLSSPGYQEKTIKASVQIGYRLIVNVEMASQAVAPIITDLSPSPTASPSVTPAISPKVSPTPTTALVTITPLPKQATSSAVVAKPYVEILATPTNFLRVRATAGASGTEVAQVNPGDKFPYLDIQTIAPNDWYQIEYQAGKNGWVSGQYSKLVK